MRALLRLGLLSLFACGSRTSTDGIRDDASTSADSAAPALDTVDRLAPPRNVRATTNRSDFVLVSFEPGGPGADAFQVLRDGRPLARLPADARSYEDTSAQPSVLGAPQGLQASLGTRSDGVELRWQAPTEAQRARRHRYSIVAVSEVSFSVPSEEVEGERVAAAVLGYELSRDAERSWEPLGTDSRHLDEGAPEAKLQPGRAHSEVLLVPDRWVRLELPDALVSPAEVDYRVRAVTADGPGLSSQKATGARKPPAALTYRWQRAEGLLGLDFQDLATGSGPSWYDHDLKAGTARRYRALVSAGSLNATSESSEARALPRVRQPRVGYSACTLYEDDSLFCEGIGFHRGWPVGRVPGSYKRIGADYTLCALDLEGHMRCWGTNDFGTAPPGPSATSYLDLALNGGPLCVLRASDRGLECSSSFSNHEPNAYPQAAFLRVSAARATACGIRLDGALVCWGPYPIGPTEPTTTKYKEVSAGDAVCAVQDDGALRCWNSQRLPTVPEGAADLRFTEVGVGVALTDDGRLFRWSSWAAGWRGMLVHPERRYLHLSGVCGIRDDGHFDCSADDPRLPSADEAVDVIPGSPLCSIDASGETSCDETLPAAAPARIRAVASGNTATCILDEDGRISCTPHVGYTHRPSDPYLPLEERYASLIMNGVVSCGLCKDGRVLCAFQNSANQPPQPLTGRYTQLVAGAEHVCALRKDGVPECFGSTVAASVPGEALEVPLIALAAANQHSCALREDQQLVCWGQNTFGQAPLGPQDASDLVDLVAHADQTCGLRSDGRIRCWGSSVLQGLSLGRYTRLRAGDAGICGVRDDRKVVCWSAALSGPYMGVDGKPLIRP